MMSETPLSAIGMGSGGWKLPSSSTNINDDGYTKNTENNGYDKNDGNDGNRHQTVLLYYIDGELSSEEEKSATNSLQSLVNQFGSRSLQWEVVRLVAANQEHQNNNNHHHNNATRQTLPCVWISKREETTTGSVGGNIIAVVSRCIHMAPSKTSSDWRLDTFVGSAIKPSSQQQPNSTCLARQVQVGPRRDFWQRVINFERVGLWVQSSSIRTHIWNLALVQELSSSASSSLEPWLSNTIHKLSMGKVSSLEVGRNTSEFVVTKPMDEYRPIPYFRDLLTSVFTIVVWEPESTVSSLPNLVPRGNKQRQKTKRKQSLERRRTLFWRQLQEIILTGAIPIVVMVDDDSSTKTQIDCNHEWFIHSTSPILRVSNQEDRIETLLATLIDETPAKWNERQIELREWYQGVMIQRALQVENWILETTPSVGVVPPSEIREQLAKEHWKSSMPSFLQQRKYDPKPLCLTPPFYGRTNNKVIEIGKLLKLSYQEGKHRALALDRRWSNWYRPQFDERPDVLLDYYPHGECEKVFTAKEAFEIPDWDLSYLIHLLPRQDYRERAEKIMNTWQHGKDYISVHRRDLEGSCHVHARCSDVELETSTCLQKRDPSEVCSVELRLQACDMEYDMVPNPEGLPIVLFTDGQVPAKDATFPHMFNTTDFFVEMWLMVNSKTHWGNPRSTVDAVVSSWRQGRGMEPKECYPP